MPDTRQGSHSPKINNPNLDIHIPQTCLLQPEVKTFTDQSSSILAYQTPDETDRLLPETL